MGVRDLPIEEDLAAFYQPHAHNEHRMAAYWALVTLLGAPLEGVLLVDRVLFLRENNVPVRMLPLFAAECSARNMVLVACRPGCTCN